ncbi:UNVERIFIED_ORG: hypothetical protein ABIB19_003437 [Arthrobacter sp. UYEF10]
MMVTENHSTHAAGVQAELHQDRYLGRQDLTRWKNPAARVMPRTAEKIGTILGPHATLVGAVNLSAVSAAMS